MEHILAFDWAVFCWIEETLWNPLLDSWMVAVTKLGDGLVWVLLTLALWLHPKPRRAGTAVAIALLLSVVVGNGLLKHLIGRPRPFDLPAWQEMFRYPELILRPDSPSFPSGHTGAAVGAATALAMSEKKWWTAAIVLLALLIGFSRVYLHVHYPTDVLAGAAIGVCYGLAGCLLGKKVHRRIRSVNLK